MDDGKYSVVESSSGIRIFNGWALNSWATEEEADQYLDEVVKSRIVGFQKYEEEKQAIEN